MPLEAQQELIDQYAGTLDDELLEEEPFLAVIVVDQLEPGKFKGPQWHLGVKPVDFVLQGKTGAFHEYYALSKAARSKMGAAVTGFRGAGVKSLRIGKGDLIGTVLWFVRRDIRFGKGSDGQPIVAQNVLVPFKTADEAEVTRGKAVYSGEPVVPAAASLEWDEAKIEAVMGVIAGFKPTEIQRVAIKSPLESSLKQAILSGAALDHLLASGVAVLDADGKVQPA